MKVLHTADWHIGTFKGPAEDGVNLRLLDTKHCLDFMVERAERERPELVLVSGDIFHAGKTWSDRCCKEVVMAIDIITRLAAVSGQVVVMRGTPNHDGVGPFEVLKTHFGDLAYFAGINNIHIVDSPRIVQTDYADIAVLPGFEAGEYRAKFPGLGKEEENEVFSAELGNIVMGLRAQCRVDRPAVLMAHYTVPGCNTESGQSQILTQFEPIVPVEALTASGYDLVALGHIHRPQALESVKNAFYSGSINANNFNDEGQERGFWIHHFETGAFGQAGTVLTDSEFIKTPYRGFVTLHFSDEDVAAVIQGRIEEVAFNFWRWNDAIFEKIVRILYTCSPENQKAFNTVPLEKALYEDGAFWVSGITPERIEASANRQDFSQETDPEANLRAYLKEKGEEDADIERLIFKARPVIAEALASETGAAFSGLFVPLEIEVKNYRAYAEETFSFEDIQFCTINGQNGAGKSSLFMDAIIDCLFEEPREGKSTSVKVPWLRNDDSVRSGYIAFTFSIGDSTYRVVRTRAKSGKGTLNLSELVGGEWQDRSQEKFNDTQMELEKIIGVDSLTFRSCALIMQDQYGLFLQAKKDERMVILGNLLGLGIYGAMEDIAKDIAIEKNRIIAAKNQSIKVQAENILAAGKPMEERERAVFDLQNIDLQLREKNAEKESAMIALGAKREAQARRKKLLEGISILNNKKRAIGENREAEQQIIEKCEVLIAGEEDIKKNTGRYRELEKREKELITGATLYSQTSELTSANSEILTAENEIRGQQEQLEILTGRLEKLSDRGDEEEIRHSSAEYNQKKTQLEKAYEKERSFRDLEQQLSNIQYKRANVISTHSAKRKNIELTEQEQRKKAELLEHVECLDIENAKCAFLADAIAAKNLLPGYALQYSELDQRLKSVIEPIDEQIAQLQKKMEAIGYDKEEVSSLRDECERLKPYADKLEELNQRDSQIALLQASIENTQSNISKTEERLLTLKSKALRLTEEREKHKESYLEHERVLEEMRLLKPWLDKENQLPVQKERRDNAVRRKRELSEQLKELETEILEKQEQAEVELQAAAGVEEAEQLSKDLQRDIEVLNEQAKQLQIRIGALKQKIEEIKRIRDSIAELQRQVAELSEDAADYERLKVSFSQDGIPHQIIRTIIPKLSVTANNILSQMTGGQLGVDFRTEKVLKSNNKKEVVTLDIFIEEYGKSSLPYLSKSGGEKVKASLSVILALAEIKASTAGIQFGMLFIDEPPFLDSDGIQAYCDALETIRERYSNIKIMAITHDPTMKSRFPQSLDIVKTENGSKVIY